MFTIKHNVNKFIFRGKLDFFRFCLSDVQRVLMFDFGNKPLCIVALPRACNGRD